MNRPDPSLIPAFDGDTLVPMDKLEVHKRGLRHLAISIFVLSDQGVLLQQRAFGKYHTPGLWANTCCTHPLWGESAHTCANRRLEQELGITGLTPIWREQVEYRAEVGNGMTEHELVEIFVAHAPSDLKVNLNPDEVAAIEWMRRPALEAAIAAEPARFTPWLRIYLADHADAIFG